MGLYAEFSITNDWGFPSQIKAKVPYYGEKIVDLDYFPACEVFINTFMDLATSYVPVDTGFLESTIEADTDGDTCWAEAWADYAQYVEYGTSKMSAQPFFEEALETACIDAFFVVSAIYREGCEELEEWLEDTEDSIEADDERDEDEDSGGSSKDTFVASLVVLILLMIIQAAIDTLLNWETGSRRGFPEGAVASIPEVIIT